MAEEKKEAPKIEHVENIHAPEVYADWASHFSMSHGNVKITFVSNRTDTEMQRIATIVIGRLTMPVAGAQSLAEGLYNFLQQQSPNPQAPDKTKLN